MRRLNPRDCQIFDNAIQIARYLPDLENPVELVDKFPANLLHPTDARNILTMVEAERYYGQRVPTGEHVPAEEPAPV